MKKESKKNTVRSRAELLIEEAVKALEKHDSSDGDLVSKADSEASQETPEKRITGEQAIARVDLQQYVDKETYLRVMADFENFRKRAAKERAEAERVGREKVLREFLEILDNLERGLQQAKEDEGAIASGMRMIMSQAEIWLKSQGLERIVTVGEVFDPSLHEAVAQRPDGAHETGTVLEEVRRGYRWWDRLLRPATVVVCKNADDETTSSSL